MAVKPTLQVNIHEAKTHLSRYVERASHGETVVIAKAGKPVAKLVPIDDAKRDPRWFFGSMRDDGAFDENVSRELDEEIAKLFAESAEKPW